MGKPAQDNASASPPVRYSHGALGREGNFTRSQRVPRLSSRHTVRLRVAKNPAVTPLICPSSLHPAYSSVPTPTFQVSGIAIKSIILSIVLANLLTEYPLQVRLMRQSHVYVTMLPPILAPM